MKNYNQEYATYVRRLVERASQCAQAKVGCENPFASLAMVLGADVSSVYRWMNGKSSPNGFQVWKLEEIAREKSQKAS